MEILAFISAVLSIIAAIISIAQANKAKSIKDELTSDRRRSKLIELSSSAAIARKEARKISTPVGKPTRGVSPEDSINTIQDLTEKIQDNISKFESLENLKSCLRKLNGRVLDYKKEKKFEKRHQLADKIYDLTREISEIINSEIEKY